MRNERLHVAHEVFPFPHVTRPRAPRCLTKTWSWPFEREISAPEKDVDKANFEAHKCLSTKDIEKTPSKLEKLDRVIARKARGIRAIANFERVAWY